MRKIKDTDLEKVDEWDLPVIPKDSSNNLIWDIPKSYNPHMRVPGRIFLSKDMLCDLEKKTIEQIVNVASLPGIYEYSMAMPDTHMGYGFPIGGVAAFDAEEGIISPGGVGFDINCGVRLIRTNLQKEEITPKLKSLIDSLFNEIPKGVGSKSKIRLTDNELDDVFTHGATWAVENGYGVKKDIEHCEGFGLIEGADPTCVSELARKRGKPQIGTLGSGNHFVEVQSVSEMYDGEIAKNFGLESNQVVIMVHCGSRGAGHQICTDYVKVMNQAVKKYGIHITDKQLACAPAKSREAQNYYKAMACATNYAWTNRQIITHWIREVFEKVFKMDSDALGMDLIYDVAHNVAKLETHAIDGIKKKVFVHRKGATRAFGPEHADLPKKYKKYGQPVLIPGSMGTPSYILHGTNASMDLTFGSACHGAGRVMSRSAAKRQFRGTDIEKRLGKLGIIARATHPSVIAEEAPEVYKSSSSVVNVVHELGIAKKVTQVIPMGVIKG